MMAKTFKKTTAIIIICALILSIAPTSYSAQSSDGSYILPLSEDEAKELVNAYFLVRDPYIFASELFDTTASNYSFALRGIYPNQGLPNRLYGAIEVDSLTGTAIITWVWGELMGDIETINLLSDKPLAKIVVLLNGEEINFADQSPIIENGRTLVPLRAIFETMGATVDWNGATQTVTARRDEKIIQLTIGSTKAIIDGKKYFLDVAPTIYDGRTLVPVRFVAESFDAYVWWEASTRTVAITDSSEAYLTSRVKAYTSKFDNDELTQIIENSNLDDREKYLAIGEILNSFSHDDKWALEELLTSGMYIAHLFRNYIMEDSAARATLYLSSAVFAGEVGDYALGKWPEKEKYKIMLQKYITDTTSSFEVISLAQEVQLLVENILKTSYSLAADPKVKKIAALTERIKTTQTSELESLCDNILDEIKSLSRTEKNLQIISDNSSLSKILGGAGRALKVINITADTIQDFTLASKNAAVYQNYINIFEAIAADTGILPLALKVAAQEIEKELTGHYETIINNALRSIGGVLIDGVVDIAVLLSTGVLASITSGLSIGVSLGNLFLGMRELTDGAAYTIGYAYLCDLFTKKLDDERKNYLALYNQSYDSAVQAALTFKKHYETLRTLRISGESAYRDMASFDNAILKTQLRNWYGFDEKNSFVQESIQRLESYVFH